MAISLKHNTLATGPDAGDGEIGKNQWNEDHVLSLSSGVLLGRASASYGAAEEIALGSRLSLSGGALDLNLATGTVSTSSPILDMSQTWNSSGTTFTALKLNVTDTASVSTSLLLDLQVGGTSKFSVAKNGTLTVSAGIAGSPAIYYPGGGAGNAVGIMFDTTQTTLISQGTPAVVFAYGTTRVSSTSSIGWSSSQFSANTNAADLTLFRDAANTLAQRNSTNAQAFRLYNTYTDSSNYERGFVRWTSNVLEIGTEAAGTGTARDVAFKSASGKFTFPSGSITFADNITIQNNYGNMNVGVTSNTWTFNIKSFRPTNNTSGYVIGGYPRGGGSQAPYELTIAGSDAYGLETGSAYFQGAALYIRGGNASSAATGAAHGGNLYLDGGRAYGTGSNGAVVLGSSYYRMLAFGGVAATTPGLKHSGTALKARLADDSDDAPFSADTVSLKARTIATLPAGMTSGTLSYATDGGLRVYDGSNWVSVSGSTSPGGSSGQLQYNAAGSFAGMSGTTWDNTNQSLAISGATLTTNAPLLDLAQTWNSSTTTFTGLRANLVDTASASGSKMVDIQYGGTSLLQITKPTLVNGVAGTFYGLLISHFNNNVAFTATGQYTREMLYFGAGGNRVGIPDGRNLTIGADTANNIGNGVVLLNDAANVLALKNSTSANALRIYNTFTDTSNYERAFVRWSSNVLQIGAEAAGTGTGRELWLKGGNTGYLTFTGNVNADLTLTMKGTYYNTLTATTDLTLGTAAVNMGNIYGGYLKASSGALTFLPSDFYDTTTSATITIAAHLYEDKATRPFYITGSGARSANAVNITGGNLFLSGGRGASTSSGAANGGHVYLEGGQAYGTGLTGSIVIGGTRYRMLAFGGLTATTPGLKHSGTTLKARLADDSDDAPVSADTVTMKVRTTGTLPAAPTAGTVAYVSDNGGSLRVYNGTSWVAVGSSGGGTPDYVLFNSGVI